MDIVLGILFFGTGLAALVGLVNPRWVGMRSRALAFLGFTAACFISLLALGFYVQWQEKRMGAASPAGADSAWTGGSGADSAASGSVDSVRDDAGPAGEEVVLRSDGGPVQLSSSRDRWERRHVVAELPSGTDVLLLERDTVRGTPRCRVRTTFQPRVEGWVMCGNVQ